MEILESCLSAKPDLDELVKNPNLKHEDFLLGILSSQFLSSPNIVNARLLLKLSTELEGQAREKLLSVFLEILIRLLENSHKPDQIESLFECSSGIVQSTGNQFLLKSLGKLLNDLLERVNSDLGLKLLRGCLDHVSIEYHGKALNLEDLNNLDISIEAEPTKRFHAVTRAYNLCKEAKRYTVINSIAFRCIDHALRYEIEDFRGYHEIIEPKLEEFIDQFTYEQRLKLSKLYQSGMQKVKLLVNNSVVRRLEGLKFSDKSCINPASLDFTFLVEDILQFDLSDQVIRDRIKSLHGKFKGKAFAWELLTALKAITDDHPGYTAMEKVSKVLKPLKLLSKNEYKRYRRNERKIDCHEPIHEEIPYAEQPNFSDLAKAASYYSKFSTDQVPEDSQITQALQKIVEIVEAKHPGSLVEAFGSYKLKTLVSNSSIDLTVSSNTIEDDSAFMYALKVLLSKHGEAVLVPSKSLPIVKYTPENMKFSFNISLKNYEGVKSTELLEKYLRSEKIRSFIKSVKLWASSLDMKNTKKGMFSGYEWTLLAIGYLQKSELLPLVKDLEDKEYELHQNLEEVFWRFIWFCYSIEGKAVCLHNGLVEMKNENVIAVVNPSNGKVFTSRVKRNRKQGIKIRKLLVKTLEELSS